MTFPEAGSTVETATLNSFGSAGIRDAYLAKDFIAPQQKLFARRQAQPGECNHLHLRGSLDVGSRTGLDIVSLGQQRIKSLAGLVGADLDRSNCSVPEAPHRAWWQCRKRFAA